jgi:hypothetical protein
VLLRSPKTGSITLSSSITHNNTLGILGSTSYYHLSSGVYSVLTSGMSTSYNHEDLSNLLGSSSYYHVSSSVFGVLTTGLSSSYSHDNLTDLRGSSSYYHLSSTELLKLQNTSTSVASTSHNGLDGILGSSSYYHVSSGVYAALTSGLSTNNVLLDTSNTTSWYVTQDTDEPNGFTNRTDSTPSWVDGTRTFALAGTHYIYRGGKKETKTSSEVSIPDVTGQYWMYYTSTGLKAQIGFPGFSEPLAGIVYWNSTGAKGCPFDERHGIIMDSRTHEYLHDTVGTRYQTGLAGTFASTSFEVSSGIVHDEDIEFAIPKTTSAFLMHKIGAEYVWTSSNHVPYIMSSGNLMYNSSGALQVVGVNDFVAEWVFATNALYEPIKVISGQRSDTTLANARANNTYDSLVLGSLPSPEFKVIYRILYKNPPAGPEYVETQDLRSISNLPAGTYVPTDHGGLSGLADDDHTIYALLSNSRGDQTFDGNINFSSGIDVTGSIIGSSSLILSQFTTSGLLKNTSTGLITGGNILAIDELSDVDTASDPPAKNEVLKWDGTNWVPAVYSASFTFSVASFSDGQTGTQMIGVGTWKSSGQITFTASYNNGPATSSYVSQGAWASLPMTGVGFVGPTLNDESVNYPAVGSAVTFTLNADCSTESATASDSVYFYNSRFWGASAVTSGYTEADIEGLASNELSNSKAKTFSVTPTSSQYIMYSYPNRLSTATFYVGGFEGGFESPETVSVTNALGYAENYYIYRSTNKNLGATTVTVV